jgi:hypothetical protein
MVLFHSYVSLPEGSVKSLPAFFLAENIQSSQKLMGRVDVCGLIIHDLGNISMNEGLKSPIDSEYLILKSS